MDYFNTTPDEKMEMYNHYTNSVSEPIIYQGVGLPDIDTTFEFETPAPVSIPTLATTQAAKKVEIPKADKPLETPKKTNTSIASWSNNFRNNLDKNVSKYLDEVSKRRATTDSEDDTPAYLTGTVDSKYNGYSGPADLQELKKRLGWAESNHNYGAVFARTKKDGSVGSGAWGRYQFVWHWSGDDIKKTTGVKNAVEFLNSPEAQEKYFDHYFATTLKPKLASFKKKYPKSGLSDTQIMEMMHFQGPDTFIKLFGEGKLDHTGGKHNPSIRKRLDANYSQAELNSKPKLKIPMSELRLLSK